jgi:hypothetical protein
VSQYCNAITYFVYTVLPIQIHILSCSRTITDDEIAKLTKRRANHFVVQDVDNLPVNVVRLHPTKFAALGCMTGGSVCLVGKQNKAKVIRVVEADPTCHLNRVQVDQETRHSMKLGQGPAVVVLKPYK